MLQYLPWIVLIGYMTVLLCIDFFVFNKKGEIPSTAKAVKETLFFVVNGLAFSGLVFWFYQEGMLTNAEGLTPFKAMSNYLSGYTIELSLSVDNLFVIALIFASYKIPREHEHKLLFLGIVGAFFFRGLLITVGLLLINQIEQITIAFGLFLLWTAFKILKEEDEDEVKRPNWLLRFFNISKDFDGGKFRTTVNGKRMFTALFGALITIEITDVLFALDSIPAIFSVTTDPFIVMSSNIFAIMGLRSMYFFLANMLDKFSYLKYSVFVILVFVSIKLILMHFVHFPEWLSLPIIATSLIAGVLYSIYRMKKDPEPINEEE
jgi:TerC family integral membrane protein